MGSTAIGSLPPVGQPSTGAIDPQRAQQYSKQQRWLLFLRHASKCTAQEGQCNISPHCHMARQLWTHLGSCRERDCQYNRCNASRTLLHHYKVCTDPRCPVCGPVKQMINKRPQTQSLLGQGSPASILSGAFNISSPPSLVPGGTMSSPASAASGSLDADLQPPPAKRVKVEPGSLNGSTALQLPQQQASSKAQPPPQVAGQQPAPNRNIITPKVENQSAIKSEGAGAADPILPKTEQIGQAQTTVRQSQTVVRQAQVKVETTVQVKTEQHLSVPAAKVEPGTVGVDGPATAKQEAPSSTAATSTATMQTALSAKAGKPKIVGTSLTELFTPEMIREHITGLRQWVGQV
jgi:E1A/CREB-binding protein